MTPATQKIQGLLFVAGEAVSRQELAKLIEGTQEHVDACIEELTGALTDSGLALVSTGTHVQLTTAPSVADYLATFQSQEAGKLTKAAAEALALIAYRGPLSRYDIDIIRGVDSRGIIRSLTHRGVITQVQKAGKTPLYDITEDFLRNLGITKREELPDYETLRTSESVTRILDQTDSQ